MQLKYKKEEFLEKLMARIILAGGRRVEPSELKEMKLGNLMDLIYPNMIELDSRTVKQIEYTDERDLI